MLDSFQEVYFFLDHCLRDFGEKGSCVSGPLQYFA